MEYGLYGTNNNKEPRQHLMNLLYEKLQTIYENAKKISGVVVDECIISTLTAEVLAIAEQCTKLGSKFGVTLQKAAPNLFTFLRHPGVDPTNNIAERVLRSVVIQRKIRQKMIQCRRYGGCLVR